MNYAKQALTALNNGLTQYRPGTKEIEWVDIEHNPITVEIIDANTEQYIVRFHEPELGIDFVVEYKGEQKHGKCMLYDEWELLEERHYEDGELHGPSIWYYSSGDKLVERHYDKGKLTYEHRYYSS